MAEGLVIHVLAAVRIQSLPEFRTNLSKDSQLKLTFVTDEKEARETLADAQRLTDVFVVDNDLGGVFELVKELRQMYPRLLIILVDQEADFGMPGHADEVSVTPFENDDLLKRIKRLNEERSLQTLRADALPPVRAFAKSLRRAGAGPAKMQAAVEAIKELGYDYVAFYNMVPTTPPEMRLSSQIGPSSLLSIAPQQQDYQNSLVGWVTQNGQSRIIGPEDLLNHPFVKQQRFNSGVCVPVGTTLRFGVIFACREQPNAITQQNVMMLELVSAQLASALAKQARS
ncbi:MAG: GAF domain-containing protein [Chloroflexi bacterium]|nr:GAF domain-containing protein [Chloroflexota bacterium]